MSAGLYLLIGPPGAGKTTVAKAIADATGAKHLWADAERHKLFKEPKHTHEESTQLYERLNQVTEYLLSNGKSVVFDTNFNFAADRQKLREIAARHKANTLVVWVTTPIDLAKQRAVHSGDIRNGYMATMTEEHFDSIVAHLEPPTKDEKFIKIDGTKLDADELKRVLQL